MSIAAESCFGWGETVVNGGGIRYTANITQTRTSRPIVYEGSGVIDVPAGVRWMFMTNAFTCAKAVVTKKGAGVWQSYDPVRYVWNQVTGARWIVHEGVLKACNGDMFAGHTGSHNLVIEVHEDGQFQVNNAGSHLPVCAIVLRGGTMQGYYGQFMGTWGVEAGGRWKGWGLNGPITVLPSLNGKPSRIIARASHLHHGNDPQSTTFDVQDGATLEIDATLHPGIQQSSANPNLGSFVKTGGGTLKLLQPCGAKGTIDIRDGTVELAAGVRFDPLAKVNVSPRAKLVLGDRAQLANATDAASALCATADVWLDASRLSLADGATVSSVPNLGTAGGNFAKFTWTAGSWRIPDLPTYKANGINGKGVLNFNGVQALCLPTYTNKTENLQVFYVSQWTTWTPNGGMGKWGGPMSFGNRKMTGDDNGEYGVLTYQHWDGSSVVPMVTLTKGASPSVRTAAVGTPYLVSSYLTRTSIGSTVYVSDDVAPVSNSGTHPVTNVNVELVCVGGRTAVGGAAQVKSTTPTSGAADRMYIGYIGEMLAFTRTLTADEEAQILAYLKRKWFNSTVAVPEETEKALANTVRIEVPEGAEASYVANVATATDGANFDLTKTGAGTLRYGGAVTGGAVLDVAEGGLKLKDGALPSHVDVWIDASDASTITLDAESRVTNLVNKGAAGGSFVRNARRSTVPYGPTVKTGEDGMNGNPVLAFDGNEALVLNSYTNYTSPRNLYVYIVKRRMKWELNPADATNGAGHGKWGSPFALGSATATTSDENVKGVIHVSEGAVNSYPVDLGGTASDAASAPALGTAEIFYLFNDDGRAGQDENRPELRASGDRPRADRRPSDGERPAAVVRGGKDQQPHVVRRHRRDDRHDDAAGASSGERAARVPAQEVAEQGLGHGHAARMAHGHAGDAGDGRRHGARDGGRHVASPRGGHADARRFGDGRHGGLDACVGWGDGRFVPALRRERRSLPRHRAPRAGAVGDPGEGHGLDGRSSERGHVATPGRARELAGCHFARDGEILLDHSRWHVAVPEVS